MALSAGTRLGHYEIQAAIGAGGMGEVYRARDSRLGREVAIKILPDSFAHDPQRVSRFEREAQLLATLNHPHIAAIYGLEKTADAPFLPLELVDGDTLADRLRRPEGLRLPGDGLPGDGAAHRPPDCGCAPGRARQGDRSPRSEAGQHRARSLIPRRPRN